MKGVHGHIRSNAVAYLALFVALGGTGAYAAGELGSSDIKRNAIKSRHIAKGQVKPKDLNEKARPLWAVVNADATAPAIVRKQGATTLVRIAEGVYEIQFKRPVGNCAFSATTRGGNTHISAITTGLNPPAGLTPREIRVDSTNSAGAAADRDFSVIAFC